MVGRVLGYLRELNRLDQAVLASAFGISQSTWSRIENGQSALTVDQLARAATALSMQTSQILAMVDQSALKLERKGVRVEYKKPSEDVSPGLVLIGAAALTALLVEILAKSK